MLIDVTVVIPTIFTPPVTLNVDVDEDSPTFSFGNLPLRSLVHFLSYSPYHFNVSMTLTVNFKLKALLPDITKTSFDSNTSFPSRKLAASFAGI